MATIQENKFMWNDEFCWVKGGEGWSKRWGSSYMQWYGTLLPRIHTFFPASTILEIAPGFGRWTKFFKESCHNLVLVELLEKCIKACQERFISDSHISYFVNDGKSLDMIPDDSIDFIFSYDSLVHVEDDVISAYVSQFPRILKHNGVAFLHHSNLGEYSTYSNMQVKLSRRVPKLLGTLVKLGVLDDIRVQWRAPSMTAKKM